MLNHSVKRAEPVVLLFTDYQIATRTFYIALSHVTIQQYDLFDDKLAWHILFSEECIALESRITSKQENNIRLTDHVTRNLYVTHLHKNIPVGRTRQQYLQTTLSDCPQTM